jgi:hypothetical protein
MSRELARTITADAFAFNADELLNRALDTLTPTNDAMNAAKDIINLIERVDSGTLVVQPPLSPEQVAAYSTSAHAVVTSTERALVGLDTSRRGRKRLAKLATASMEARIADPKAAHRPGSSYQGKASERKS